MVAVPDGNSILQFLMPVYSSGQNHSLVFFSGCSAIFQLLVLLQGNGVHPVQPELLAQALRQGKRCINVI